MTDFTGIEPDAGGLRARIEATIRACERELGLTITLHDLHGLCRDESGQPLLMRRNEHAHPLCRLERPRTMRRCNDHCVTQVHAEAARRRAPFATWCWKGIRELVVPLVRDEVLVAVLYAGAWRRPRARPRLEGVPRRSTILARQAELPLWDAARARHLAEHLSLWGHGLLELIERHRFTPIGSRAERIRRFLERHAHEAVGLEDLAVELGCSPSRAGHVVVEELGASWRELLQRERIDRAKVLLLTCERPLAWIAEACGFRSEYYFNRAFARRVGQPPGRWRAVQHQRWDG